MAWVYREATAADVPAMGQLYQSCYDSKWNCTPDLVEFDIEVIEKLVSGKHLHTIVLEEDGVLAGFISMWTPTEPQDEAFGDVIAIDLVKYKTPPRRKEVVGRILGGMWRIMQAKGRTKIKTDLKKAHVEAIGLIRGLPVIPGYMDSDDTLEIPADIGIAWADYAGY